MEDVDRRSEFNLIDEEKEEYRKQNNRQIEDEYKQQFKEQFKQEITDEQACKMLLIDLYYNIGMDDYYMYKYSYKGFSKQEVVEKYLQKRACYSARLQVLIDDMRAKGYDVDAILDPKITEKYKFNSASKDLLYHGTNENIEPSQIGAPDKDGFYYIRDGISYWSTSHSDAERYGKNIYSKEIENGVLCANIQETHGGAFAMWQDELINLNKNGVKYIFSTDSKRADVLDIERFADFVKSRDKGLLRIIGHYGFRLPLKNESLKNYLIHIENAKKIDNLEPEKR